MNFFVRLTQRPKPKSQSYYFWVPSIAPQASEFGWTCWTRMLGLRQIDFQICLLLPTLGKNCSQYFIFFGIFRKLHHVVGVVPRVTSPLVNTSLENRAGKQSSRLIDEAWSLEVVSQGTRCRLGREKEGIKKPRFSIFFLLLLFPSFS